MDEKTARKYRKLEKLPSEVAPSHTWRTREDPFAEIWPEVYEQLELNSGLEAKTLFAVEDRLPSIAAVIDADVWVTFIANHHYKTVLQ